MRTTEIEWAEHTWNPWVGCDKISAGCRHCYAVEMAARIDAAGSAPWYRDVVRPNANDRWHHWSGKVVPAPDAVFAKPESILEPSLVCVGSMSDFWHPGVPAEMRRSALAVMDKCQRHVFQVLTKRPERIAPMLLGLGRDLPGNVWAGATIEDASVKHRVNALRQVRASVRFLACEPLLGSLGALDLDGIHWVIVGGESGTQAREIRPEWVAEIRDQCQAAGVPFFFKQWGTPAANPAFEGSRSGLALVDPVGKGGSLFEGRSWKAMPAGWQSPNAAPQPPHWPNRPIRQGSGLRFRA